MQYWAASGKRAGCTVGFTDHMNVIFHSEFLFMTIRQYSITKRYDILLVTRQFLSLLYVQNTDMIENLPCKTWLGTKKIYFLLPFLIQIFCRFLLCSLDTSQIYSSRICLRKFTGTLHQSSREKTSKGQEFFSKGNIDRLLRDIKKAQAKTNHGSLCM